MRILLANHHLNDLAGSELYTAELAESLSARGHDVAVFTFVPGKIAEQRFRPAGIPVFSPGNATDIEAFAPEVLHVHHAPCLYYLGALRISAAAVFSSLGVVPALEGPPIAWAGVGAGLVVSEEVRARLADSSFARGVELQLFRNWFDDRGLERAALKSARAPRRWVVVSNHLAPTLASQLDALRGRDGFEWSHVGMPSRSRKVDAELLRSFDGVITIGRTALLAGALGKPCLLYDVHGCDGFLSAERLSHLATRNFSGRLHAHRPSMAELESLLFEQAERLDLHATADHLWSGFRLTGRVDELLALYRRLAEGSVRMGEATRASYGRAGQVHAELVADIRHWRLESIARAGIQADTERRLVEAQRRIAELESHVRGLETSAAWKVLARFRHVKDRLLPHGSAPRGVYDRGLATLKRRRRR